jgi:serine/threonine-protein kinase HipA
MTKTEKLAVFSHLDGDWAPCGLLSLTEDAAQTIGSSFAYGTRYIDRVNALEIDPVALGFKNKAEIRGKALLPPAGLTLFGGIRDAAPDAWGRRVIESKLKVPPNSLPESTYLLHAGSDRVGALDVRPNLQSGAEPGISEVRSLQYLIEAADRIEEGLPVPANLESIFIAGTALGGARPKASIRDNTGVLWLAKFSGRNEPVNLPWVEYGTLQLAREVGLVVPTVKVEKIGDRTAMLIQRFDRYWDLPDSPAVHAGSDTLARALPGGGRIEKRLAFISGLTLLGCHEAHSMTKSYGDLADAIRKYCHPAVVVPDTKDLFRRMVYNIFVTNNDDHLRNHGFVWDPRYLGWRLSPLYDVTPNTSAAQDRFLHLGVGPQGKYAHLDNALAAHSRFRLSETVAAEVIAQVWGTLRVWKVRFEASGVPGEQIEKVQTAFRHIDDVSTVEMRRKLK